MRLFSRPKCKALAPVSDFMPRTIVRYTNNDDDNDSSSIESYSTMATSDSQRGAGWTLDRYFYQRAGRWLETWASRIGLRFGAIPPFIIARHLHELLHSTLTYQGSAVVVLCGWTTVRLEFAESDRVTISNGIDCLLKQLQSPSLSRRAVACAVLIRFQSFRGDTLRRTHEALSKCYDTKSIRGRAETFCSSFISRTGSHQVYSRLLLEFLRVCVDRKGPSDSDLFIKSAKTNLLRLMENIQSSSYDIVLIVHESCVTLQKCLLVRDNKQFVEIFYFYMCFVLNILQHVLQPSNASVKDHQITLIPYIHWIDSILPSVFIRISADVIYYYDITVFLNFYSLFALPQTRNLFPRFYTETNFSSGCYMAAKTRAAIDSSSFIALLSHVRGDITISEQFHCRRVSCTHRHGNCWLGAMRKSFRPNHPIKGMAENVWMQLILHFLDQRVWEYHITNRECDTYIDLYGILMDKRWSSKSRSSNPLSCSTNGTVLFGGDSIPVFEYSRDSRNPMTIGVLCKETGRTIYRTVKLSFEEVAALEEAEDEA